MQTFLIPFFVSGQSGKLRLTKTIAAPTENLAQRRMQRLISEHSGYKVGSPIEVKAENWEETFGLGSNGGCGDSECCGGSMLHPDKVDIWIGTDRQIYDTGRTMESAYNNWRIKVDKERDQERIRIEQDLKDPSLNQVEQEALLKDLEAVMA
jgi:hypothetical protein